MMKRFCIMLFFFFNVIYSYPTDIEIITPKKPTVTEKFAAEELCRYILRITGEKAPVLSKPTRNCFRFVVGNSGEPERRMMNLGEDDYFIRCDERKLIISGGGNRGTIYAIYDFLERLGCRWYYPDDSEEVIPLLSRDEVIKIAESLDVVEKADFSYRIYQYQTHDVGAPCSAEAREAFDTLADRIDWLCKNRFNIFQFGLDGKNSYEHWNAYRKNLGELNKRGMIPGISGHSYFLFLPDSVFLKHEDWWPERDGKRQKAGQFCTRNNEVVSYYLNNIKQFLRENSQIKYFTVWPADTYGWCNCNLCGNDSTVADRYLELSNKLSEQVRKEFPDILFNHFAYGSHLEAPEYEVPPEDMFVTVCTWGRDFSEPFTGMSAKNGWEGNYYKDDFRNEFDSWRRITEKTGSPMLFHEKYLRHLGFGFLPLPFKILEEDFRYFKECGIDGFELPMGFMGVRTKAFNLYCVARLMWDSDTHVTDLESDYFNHFYGRCGMLMKAAYEDVAEAQPNLKYFTELQKLEKDISPVEKYRSQDLDYSVKALHYFGSARKYADLALVSADNDIVKSRIRKFLVSLDYITEEYRGLLALATASGHLKRAASSDDTYYRCKMLQLARNNIEKAKKSKDIRQRMIREYQGQGLIWDINFKGPVCIFYDSDIDKYEELINSLAEQLN